MSNAFPVDPDDIHRRYMAQNNGDPSDLNVVFDMHYNDQAWMKKSGLYVPSYTSGVNPNYFVEYFNSTKVSVMTNTEMCQKWVRDEYNRRRWSYLKHLLGYHESPNRKLCLTQVKNQESDCVEFWRRFHQGNPLNSHMRNWYFDDKRTPGDIAPWNHFVKYASGYSTGLRSSFSNCYVSQTLSFGSVHVAVGFVDLGLLLDSQFLGDSNAGAEARLLFQGYEASPFAVAKSLILWEMMMDVETKAEWVVQVWFSAVWSKRATNSFLKAAKTVDQRLSIGDQDQPPEIRVLVSHWAQSKGVGLKKARSGRSTTRQESSDALFFAQKEDRVEMVHYHLTGAFGLAEEAPCSGSVLMWDCPEGTARLDKESVFFTLTVADVMKNPLWNGNYFQTAELVKVERVAVLMDRAQTGKIQVKLSLAFPSLSESPRALAEIIDLQPHSVTWSNIVDYLPADEFHALARKCSATACHSGYSMNWPTKVWGTSIIDYPETALTVLGEANRARDVAFRRDCGDKEIFLLPMQHNPLNVTAGFLSERCYLHWVNHFFGASACKLLEAGKCESSNPLHRVSTVVECSWTYTQ